MVTYAWCTDVHLDTLSPESVVAFAEKIKATNTDGVVITGDISRGSQLVYHLSVLERAIQKPIYFVLGNHDHWESNVESTRGSMKELTNMSQFLKYVPTSPYHIISPTTALVGHDGWYDALNGDWKKSTFMMNDWAYIQDFAQETGGMSRMLSHHFDYSTVVTVARKLAQQGVQHVHDGIKAAVRHYNNIVVVTHFPPWERAHVHHGKIGDANAQPWYTSRMMGDMLEQAAKAYPNVTFTVFAGHTHGKADVQVLKNLWCHVGAAEYGLPQVQQIITVT